MTPEKTTYDDLPYESFPFYYTSPEHIRAVGVIFGMNPPKLETARILELGSAAGGNLVCFASNYPKSHSVGIDLSKVQINQGIEQTKALGLKNIELKAMSITDIDESFGQFDYIICHGVYSWVPGPVRDKILEISKKNLSPNGIAYISYNTLPGWNSTASVRDMMQFHSATFETNTDKVQQAKLLLTFVADSLEGSNTPHERFLKQEVQMLQNYNESYLLHEFLEGINDPCYFHDFMKLAASKGLAYLGDTRISSMYAGNLPGNAHEKLSGIQDIVRTEQYMDFINNRKFRCTLLCHNDVQLIRNVTPKVLDELFLSMNLVPEKGLEDLDLNTNENLTFYLNGNKEARLTASSPALKAVLSVFAENAGLYSTLDTIAKVAVTKLVTADLQAVRAEIDNNLLSLMFKGMVKVTSVQAKAINSISDKPKVSDLALIQAANPNSNWVTSQINDIVPINIMERFAIRYMDGKHTKAQVIDKLMGEHVPKGELSLSKDNKVVTDSAVIKSTLEALLDQTLERFRISYMLIG